MKTKEQETKELELGRQLQEVTEELNHVQERIDKLTRRNMHELRWLVERRTELEAKKNHLINLYNVIR